MAKTAPKMPKFNDQTKTKDKIIAIVCAIISMRLNARKSSNPRNTVCRLFANNIAGNRTTDSNSNCELVVGNNTVCAVTMIIVDTKMAIKLVQAVSAKLIRRVFNNGVSRLAVK